MKTRQVTVGFDAEVSITEIAAVLSKAFGNTVVGQGIPTNGIPSGYLFVENKRRKKKDV
jgi:hypothetical protein